MLQGRIFLDQDILAQQHDTLPSELDGLKLTFGGKTGQGTIEQFSYGDDLDFYSFRYKFNELYNQQTINPESSDYYVLMVNLSKKAMSKVVNDEGVSVHKYEPIGMIAYAPGSSIFSQTQPEVDYEMLVLRFTKTLLVEYFGEDNALFEILKTTAYEDLNVDDERMVQDILDNKDNKLKSHALVLGFIEAFTKKLLGREVDDHSHQLHPEDMKGLFKASSTLRDPLVDEIPSVEELSSLAQMGATKFKSLFKQVFGHPPKQYHLRIKMNYAQQEIVSNNRSVSEVSYELGYSHPSKFTSMYKKQFGVLPTEQKAQGDF